MLNKNVNLDGACVLVTGAAGFVGANLVMELFRTVGNIEVVGIDNVNDYYDTKIKDYRLSEIEKLAASIPNAKWRFIKGNIADREAIDTLFSTYKPSVVVNLAAQAGVR